VDSSAIAIIALTVGLPLVIVVWAVNQMRKDTAGIKNGIPADAEVQGITDTGTTITTPSVGAEAPVYRFQLLVTPPSGGTPYQTQTTHAVPRVVIPMVTPGMRMGIKIDPKDPMRVVPDWSRLNAPALAASDGGEQGSGRAAGGRTVTMSFDGAPGGDYSAAAPGSIPGLAPMLSFDASGVPAAGGVESLVGAVRSGAVPTIKGSFETLIATGIRGTAVITTAMPFGKTAGQVNPSVNPERFNYPVWVFTVEVSLAGEEPFPAVFGHFVRPEKVGLLAPGVKLSVSVDPQNKYQDVAIDWDKSPLVGITA
jgi:hypothetical protein